MMVQASVIIPVYNGKATIARAVESALSQEFDGSFEVIAVDDGSTDASAKVLQRFGERIAVLRQSNRGLAAARNAGAAVARGAYLAFLDADDVWLPDKLAETIAPLEDNRLAVLAYCDVIAVSGDGTALGEPFAPRELNYAPSMSDLLTRWWPILPSAVVMRHAIFDACGGFCTEFRRAYEDVDMWLRVREHGDFEYVAKPLLEYRVTPVAERMQKYQDDYRVFARRVRERYGNLARVLLKSTRHAYVSALGHRGLIAMREGDFVAARRAFADALRYEPLDFKSALRLARSYLPVSIARALTGRTRTR